MRFTNLRAAGAAPQPPAPHDMPVSLPTVPSGHGQERVFQVSGNRHQILTALFWGVVRERAYCNDCLSVA